MIKQLLITILALLGCCTAAWADVEINEANFPDENFRNWVLSQEYGQDGVLTDAEIAGIAEIDVGSANIQSLKGIEYFTALTELSCCYNRLRELDVSKNTALETLWCYDNQLTELDVSKNTALTFLSCYSNQLTALDVSKNTALTQLSCYKNQLTELDVSNNTALYYLSCDDNQLTVLDVSKNTALEWLFCSNNQLTALDVSKNTALTQLSCYKNELTALDLSKSTELKYLHCYMNQIKGAAMDALVESLPTVSSGRLEVIWNEEEQNVMTVAQVAAAKTKGWTPFYYDGRWKEYAGSEEGIAINAENFPDENFRNYLLSQDYGMDRVLMYAEIAGVTEINVSKMKIQSLKGIEFFTALGTLLCNDNQLTELDVSKNTALIRLVCYNNQLTELDVSGCSALTTLWCHRNQLTELDVSKNTKLTELSCGYNQLTELDVSKNTALTTLACYSNQLTALDVSKNTTLTSLLCDYNRLTALDVSKNTALTSLYCYSNQLTALDVSQNTALTSLYCSGNQLTALDVSQNSALTTLQCYSNQIKDEAMDALVESLPTVSSGRLDVIWNKNEQNDITTAQVAAAKAKGWTPYYLDYNRSWKEYPGTGINDIKINEANFPDENFRNWVLSQEYGADILLTEDEIARVTEIYVYPGKIHSLKGIEFFTALTTLDCSGNQLTELDVSKNTKLTQLDCYKNQLTELDVSKNTALTMLRCYSNQLTELDVSKNTKLRTLRCYSNQLTELDVSKNTALTWLDCYNNQLTELDVSKNTALTTLRCYSNQLTELDVSNNTALTQLDCEENQLTALDVSQNTALTTLICGKNQLTELDVSKNTKLRTLYCYQNQIKGAAMDALVESLSGSTGYMYVIWNEDEQNEMTAAQVAAAKAKRWKPYAYDGSQWYEYEGSVGISRPTADSGNNGKVYDLSGRRLQRMQKGINIINGKKLLK